MNRDESIALWRKGKDAWNEWANDMLAQRKALEEAGEWQAESDYFKNLIGLNHQTRDWLSDANVDLSKLWIFVKNKSHSAKEIQAKSLNRHSLQISNKDIDFSSLIIPNESTFQDTLFDCFNINFQESVFMGPAKFEGSIFNGATQFQSAKFNSSADFNHSKFNYNSYFQRTKFIGFIDFSSSTFAKYIEFNGASFAHATSFTSATFESKAEFHNAVFSEDVSFNSTIFCGQVIFGTPFLFAKNRATRFESSADFGLVYFNKHASFAKVTFESTTTFASITSEKSFNLLGTKFEQAPDFTEAAFHAPPVLDEMKIKEPMAYRMWKWCGDKKEPRTDGMSIFKVANDPTDTRKYRALAKMAAEAKDYQNEMRFFTDEQRCRRFWHDKPFGRGMGRFWFGLLYEKASNFGRSFWRPLAGWLLSTTIFANLYALTSQGKITDWFDPIYISIRHGLIFSGLTRSEHWDSAITALYATTKGSKSTIDISNTAAGLMLAQPIISAVFIFLFLLAVRNQFKIR